MPSRKRVVVEGCPCEFIEFVDWGVLHGGECAKRTAHTLLVVAPDGSLAMSVGRIVNWHQPDREAVVRNLTRIARALRRRPRE